MTVVYARRTTVSPVDRDCAVEFTNTYHRQQCPKRLSNPYFYGLFHEGELLAVLIVANPRTSAMRRKYCHEILRLTFKDSVRVVGGASKLIAYFIKDVNPYNVFTYQSLSGEVTDVYSRCGMMLVSETPVKKALLAPDAPTINEARNNRRDWFSLDQAVRLGPDRLLGTNLGETFEDGKRLSNIDLFTKKLGYRLIDVPGDRLYEWHNPNRWHYVYKTTASDSDKYYFGRKCISKNEPTEKDCLADGYFGSGGKKFQHWAKKHKDSLQKDILFISNKWSDCVDFEEKVIGDLYQTDPLCLNAFKGGLSLGAGNGKVELRECPIHGMSKHRGASCFACSSQQSFSQKVCSLHGETTFRGESCCVCITLKGRKSFEVERGFCESHGKGAPIVQGRCLKCSAAKAARKRESPLSVKDCPEHGLVAHVKDSCSVCAAEKTLKEQRCVIHGNATHRSGRCVACSNTAFINFRDCPTHGEQPHVDDTCFVCSRDAGVSAGLNELMDSSGLAHCLSCGYGFKPKSRSALLQASLKGVNPCPVCCWWNETEVRRKARSYWVGPPVIPRMNHTYNFRCPTCGETFQLQLRSLLHRIERCGVGCSSCSSIQ